MRLSAILHYLKEASSASFHLVMALPLFFPGRPVRFLSPRVQQSPATSSFGVWASPPPAISYRDRFQLETTNCRPKRASFAPCVTRQSWLAAGVVLPDFQSPPGWLSNGSATVHRPCCRGVPHRAAGRACA